jgi:hypothetical protein
MESLFTCRTLGADRSNQIADVMGLGHGASGISSVQLVTLRRTVPPCEFCISSCKRLLNFIPGGVPIGTDRDPICTAYFQACSTV